MLQTWLGALVTSQVDGPTLTAAASASMLPPQAKIVLPAGYFDRIGKSMLIIASGRISNVVTTPGTARYDIRMDSTVVADTNAMPLNVVAKTTVGWWLEMLLTARAVGTHRQPDHAGPVAVRVLHRLAGGDGGRQRLHHAAVQRGAGRGRELRHHGGARARHELHADRRHRFHDVPSIRRHRRELMPAT
jgi:hypothetical protein